MNDLLEGTTAEWLQPRAMAQHYELRAGEILMATLTFRSSFGTLATAEAAGGRWTYKRVGFLNPRVTIRVDGSEEDLAVYVPRFWGGGTLTFGDGLAFEWKPTNFWSTQWAFLDASGNVVMSFKAGVRRRKLSDVFKTQFTLHVLPDAAGRDAISILVTLGMYLLILQHHDAAGATAATAGAAS